MSIGADTEIYPRHIGGFFGLFVFGMMPNGIQTMNSFLFNKIWSGSGLEYTHTYHTQINKLKAKDGKEVLLKLTSFSILHKVIFIFHYIFYTLCINVLINFLFSYYVCFTF